MQLPPRSELTALDPVFYLHHTQLDRLWWEWQQIDPTSRLYQFLGPTRNFQLFRNQTALDSSLDDKLYYGELDSAIQVKDVMSTETELLCYVYQ
jgi:tyrosinase